MGPQPPSVLQIAPSWHPLVEGIPPDWASAWGQDRFGVFVAFDFKGATQRLRWIPARRFFMGSPEEETRGLAQEDYERAWFEREHPRHEVFITRGFWLFDTPCTQALWEAVMGDNPSRFRGPDRPVEQVSWDAVQGFLDRLKAVLPGLALELPTEAQWEHACRAGTDTAPYSGPVAIRGLNDAPGLDPIAWYGGNSGEGFALEDGEDSSGWPQKQYPSSPSGTHPVGRKLPNPWGLYDMLGNVDEWCADGLRRYDERWQQDPLGSREAGTGPVIRGNSWRDPARFCRCASRAERKPEFRYDHLGLRCARVHAW